MEKRRLFLLQFTNAPRMNVKEFLKVNYSKMYKHFLKRILDFCIALVALLCLSPLLLVVTVWLHIANKGAGAFFFQNRPGLHGKLFKIVKFKTMTEERDAGGKLLPDANRLTKVSRFVRSTSIDEFPRLSLVQMP